jgi:PAS domain S-box-containing protein
VRDLSEQQRVEGELRRSREDLEARVRERTGEVFRQTKAMDAASEGIAIVAPGGTFLYMNAAHARVYGYERPEELLGGSWRGFYEGPQLEQFDREIFPAVLKEGRWRGTVTGRRRDGTSFPEEISLALLEGGALVRVVKDITDRRRAEQELRASEARFRTMSEASPMGIFVAGPDGGVVYVNPIAQRIAGVSEEEARGTGWAKAVHPEDREAVRARIEEVLRRKEKVDSVHRFLHRDGRVVWVSLKGGPMADGGTFLGYVGTVEDISDRVRAEEELRASRDRLEQRVQERTAELLAEVAERRRTEEALRESEERVRSLVESAQDFIQTVDRDGKILSINRVLPQYRMEEVIGSSSYGYVSEEHGKVMRAALERVFQTGQPGQYELAGPGPGGRTSWYASRISPLIRGGKVVAATIIATDITARREVEEALRFQKTLLEAQGEAAIDGILVVDAEGKMISFNRRFVEMWGIPAEIVDSRSDEAAIRSVLHKLVDPEGFISRVRHLYAHRDEESRDELRLKDGRVFDRHSAPVKSADGTYYGRVWFFRDVTERRRALEETRRAYEDLKQAQAQLIRSEKLASIGMLVSGVAHEINNPLNVMYGNLKLLAQACEMMTPLAVEGARVRKVKGVRGRARKLKGMIRDGIKAAEHARRVIEDFRHFARDTRSAELVDLNVCLQEALAILQRDLGTRVRVVRRLGAVPPVRCFRGQMNQVFLNLIKNAAEAIEDRGTITLRTFRKGRRAVVEVADTGRGMDEEVRRKLFEPFFTTKPVGKGLGLGLSISATIVQNHGGQISVRSRPRKGALFRVDLPLEG